jgi:peptidoglycan/xylan/chitin deacetylase (PgdA/CDA1 family)
VPGQDARRPGAPTPSGSRLERVLHDAKGILSMSKLRRAAALLERSRVGELVRKMGAWQGDLILGYHRIGDGSESPFDRGLWSATGEEFDRQLEYLARNFEVVGPDALLASGSPRRRRVVLTFDDGYRDNFDVAFPLLRRHGLPAIFFLATGFLAAPTVPWWDEIAWMVRHSKERAIPGGEWLDGPLCLAEPDRTRTVKALTSTYKRLPGAKTADFMDFLGEATGSGRCGAEEARALWMSWDMVREISAGGMWIGGHTATHPVLARLPLERQREEVATCLSAIRRKAGVEPAHFSYPVGLPDSFDKNTRACLRDNGIELAFSLHGGYATHGGMDPYNVPRTTVSATNDHSFFLAQTTLPQVFARR